VVQRQGFPYYVFTESQAASGNSVGVPNGI
jgi:hypothetical protein